MLKSTQSTQSTQSTENTRYNLRSNKRQKYNNQIDDQINNQNMNDVVEKNLFYNKFYIQHSNIMNIVKNIIKTNNIEKLCGKLECHKHAKILNGPNNISYKSHIYNNNSIVECMDYLDFYNKEFITNKLKFLLNLVKYTKSRSKSDHQMQPINVIFIWFLTYDNHKMNNNPILISKYIFNDWNFTNYKMEETFLQKKEHNYNVDNTWISASKTRNYLLNDPIVDYLEYNKIYEIEDLSKFMDETELMNLPKKRKLSIGSDMFEKKEKGSSFLDTIFSNGNKFETMIINKITEMFPLDTITILDISNYSNLTYKKILDPIFFEMTINAIKSGIPIIYQGVLHGKKNKSFGLPDLMIRADYLSKLFDQPIDINMTRLESTGQLPYYVIDVKNSNIHLSANSDNVLNHIGTKPFKGQIAVYHQILSDIQKYDTKKAFILASKWTRKQKDNIYTCTNPFDRLGVINFADADSEYIDNSNGAIEWLKLVQTENNELNCLKPNHDNLYPNMKNMSDGKYRKVKNFLADRNHEITNIWKCGVKNRNNAFKKNIRKWSDSKLNSSILSINGKDANIIDMMLNLNRSNSDILIKPKIIETNLNNWRDINDLAFYLDFETVNQTTFELKSWLDTEINYISTNDLIFMIGIGYSINNKWSYESFIVKDLSDEEQINIIYQMFNFIENICHKNLAENTNTQNVNIYHWSNFEQIVLTKLCAKYTISLPIYTWTDILKIFHDEPIIVKGALNFSLKSIGKAMYDNKLIDVYWDDSECKSGLDAMFQAYQIYNKLDLTDITTSIYDNKQMKIINKYNEIDCKIMWAILNYLRVNH